MCVCVSVYFVNSCRCYIYSPLKKRKQRNQTLYNAVYTYRDVWISNPKMAIHDPDSFTDMLGLANNVIKNINVDAFRWDMCALVPLQCSSPSSLFAMLHAHFHTPPSHQRHLRLWTPISYAYLRTQMIRVFSILSHFTSTVSPKRLCIT